MPRDTEPDLKTRSKLDLIDTILVLFISSAVVIFLLWISSRFLSQETFERLPEFITDAYSAFWTAGVAGGVGIGGAILKHLVERQKTDIDYLKVVIVTVFIFIFLFIVLISLAIIVPGTRDPRTLVPAQATIVDFSLLDRNDNFELSTPVVMPVPARFYIKGSYVLEQTRALIIVEEWGFEAPVHLLNEMTTPDFLGVAFCRAGYNDPNSSPFVPNLPGIRNSFSVNVSNPPVKYSGVNRRLELPIPDDIRRSVFFLCAYLANRHGPQLIAF